MFFKIMARGIDAILKLLDLLTPVGDLAARIWIAKIFLAAGLVKIGNWHDTVNLFTYVYHVPLLPPYFAAVLGTGAELILPIFLVIGFGGRIMILIFFIYNIIAAVSYHFLWTPQGTMGLDQHISWGLLLGLLMFHGPGKLSVDYWVRKHYNKRLQKILEQQLS